MYEMASDFTFKAPQFVDFSEIHNHSVDESYFEMEQDVLTQTTNDNDMFFTPTPGDSKNGTNGAVQEDRPEDNESVFFSPTPSATPGLLQPCVKPQGKFRRSLSAPHIETNQQTQKINEMQTKLSQLDLTSTAESMVRASSVHVFRRGMSQEHLNQLAKPKITSNSTEKYVSLAEAVRKFHTLTPKRFRPHTTPPLKKAPINFHNLKPQTPKLLTTQRVRPPTVLSKEEKERIEMEEVKKYKIRAHPVSQKVLRGPVKSVVEKKQCTIFQPFHLTEVKKRVEEPKDDPNKLKKPAVLSRTEPKPFSFCERDQQMFKRREEMIRKVLEEERRAREFHANPVPNCILKTRNASFESVNSNGSEKSKHHKDHTDGTVQFKARPPSVLHMKPFSPKKCHYHTVQIEEFNFNTAQRAKAREDYDRKMREVEACKEAARMQKIEEEKRREALEIQQMRKEAEHKAQPIRKYKPLVVETEHKCTTPISPIFHTTLLRNKENNVPN